MTGDESSRLQDILRPTGTKFVFNCGSDLCKYAVTPTLHI